MFIRCYEGPYVLFSARVDVEYLILLSVRCLGTYVLLAWQGDSSHALLSPTGKELEPYLLRNQDAG